MALTIAVNAAYLTADQADQFLEENSDWNNSSELLKNEALLFGRYYIDDNFDCIDYLDTVPEELMYANSLLAIDYINNPDAFKPQQKIIKKAIQAGSVKVFKEYSSTDDVIPSNWYVVDIILRRICNKYHTNMYVR